MKKKKEAVKLSAMTLREVSTITRIVGELQIECSKKAIPNTNGTYSHIVLKSIKPFVKEEIELIKKLFKKEYKSNLTFDSNKEGELFVGHLSKLA